MKQRYIVAFALIASLLLVSATPAAAASAGLAIGSQQTSDAEFSNSTTLENVSVEGSGSAGFVEFSPLSTADRFEDGDLSEYDMETWRYSINGSWSSEGSNSLMATVHADYDFWIYSSSGLSAYPAPGTQTTLQLRIEDENSTASVNFGGSAPEDSYRFEIDNVAGRVRLHKQDSSTSDDVLEEDTSVAVPENESLTATITWETDGKITASLSDSSGAVLSTISATDTTFDEGIIGFTSTSIAPYPWESLIWYDNVTIRHLAGTGQYVSSNQSVSDVRELWANLTLSSAHAAVEAHAWDEELSTWVVANSATVSASGNHSLDISGTQSDTWRTAVTFHSDGDGEPTGRLHDETYLFDARKASISDVKPADRTYVEGTETLSATISDPDFGTAQGDEVDVEFVVDGSVVGTDTLTSNGEASTSWTPSTAGTSDYTVRAIDSYGEVATSEKQTLNVPSELTVRNESDPSDVITGSSGSAEVTFFGDEGTVSKRSVDSDGNVSFEGLPADERFLATISVDGYSERTVVIASLLDQQDAFILSENATTNQIEFQLQDSTGSFPSEETTMVLSKAINFSGETRYVAIAGDEFGATDTLAFSLESDERYRIEVRNDGGDVRKLGSYTVTRNAAVPLEVGSLSFSLEDKGTYQINTSREEVSDSPVEDRLVFVFQDPESKTDSIELTVHESGNPSNVLTTDSDSGTLGTYRFSTTVSGEDANTSWVATWTAERNGETIGSSRLFGAQQFPLGAQLEEGWQTIISVGFIIVVGGLFSAGNARMGAIIVPGFATVLWYVGWMDGVATGGAIVAALSLGVAYNFAISRGTPA